jgi:sugar phosphate isomerase/epimerase
MPVAVSICSFSFHRLLGEGKQDIFQYIRDCQALGCTHLAPWNAHFTRPSDAAEVERLGRNPQLPDLPAWLTPPSDEGYLADIKAAAEQADLPFECIAVDRAHIYEDDPAKRRTNRQLACRWLDIAETLGAESIRIDAGGPEDMPEEAFRIIVEGYNDLIARGRDKGVRILTENHWGPSRIPENVVKLLESIDGLGLLFDTNNWAKGRREDGWRLCAKYAAATHVKTFAFDAAGNETSVDIPRAIRLLVETGYDGVWGIESCPRDGDEMAGARKTVALIRRTLERLGAGS